MSLTVQTLPVAPIWLKSKIWSPTYPTKPEVTCFPHLPTSSLMYPPTTLLFTLFLPPSSYLPSLMFLCLTKRTLISAPLYWQSPLLDTLFSGRSWWLVSSRLSGLCYNVISLERISQTNLSKIASFCHSVAFFPSALQWSQVDVCLLSDFLHCYHISSTRTGIYCFVTAYPRCLEKCWHIVGM